MPATASEIDELLSLPTVVNQDPFAHIDIDALLEDLARQIFTVDEILPRYGLSKDGVRELLRRPAVFAKYQAKKQHWESDANAAARLKAYYEVGLIEAAPDLLKGLKDPTIPFKERVAAHQFVAKIAGLEPDPRAGQGVSGPTGPQFAVNILFSGGATQTITATVVPPAPALEAPAEDAP